jgi:hypothetical protein
MPLTSDFETQALNIQPYVLVDVVSPTEIYYGVSSSFNSQGQAIWSIKKIYQVGMVWITGYPTGDQGYKYVWNDRGTYTYQ